MKVAIRSPEDSQDSFSGLAAAVHPAWHQAIIRLANASERIAEQLGWVMSNDQDADPAGTYADNVRDLIDQLVEFLDGLDADPDLEPTLAIFSVFREAGADECEMPDDDEPSLGSFDRMTDQVRAWQTPGRDLELDDCDDEDGDHSGCGDLEGLQEQLGGGAVA